MPDDALMQRERTADTGAKPRKRRHQGPRRKLVDGRTRTQRRIRELIAGYVAALGEPVSPLLRARIERAAQLVAIAEDSRRKAISGGIALDDLVRIERVTTAAVKQLGFVDKPAAQPAETLREYLSSRASSDEAVPDAETAA